MYEGTANEGMRGIREIIEAFAVDIHKSIAYDVFDVRGSAEVPGTDYDAYISTGGPGSPLDSAGSLWEQRYFALMESIKRHNRAKPDKPKHVFLICHSFQVFCRYYGLGHVSKRKSTSFGVMPCHKTDAGQHDPLLRSLDDPFWVVDSRDYQLTQPDLDKIEAGGGSVLCIEKHRPHVKLERAVMAIRFDDAFFGTQFHPEADASGMRMYLLRDDKKKLVIDKFGEKKYWDMLEHLTDPDKIMLTHNTVLPRFLMQALRHKLTEVAS
ncbi:MAG: GMP synthase [Cyclobacteriaceae bacterium]|nr:GMP synthase [Cyclobacteriaceae bacterium]